MSFSFVLPKLAFNPIPPTPAVVATLGFIQSKYFFGSVTILNMSNILLSYPISFI